MTTETQPYFEVAAEWLAACGIGTEARDFRVIRTYERGGWLFATLDNDGSEWDVLTQWRGRFVPAPVHTDETGPDWEPTAQTRYYAQRGTDGPFMFGPSPELAREALRRAETEAVLFEVLTTRANRKLGSVRSVEGITAGVYHPIQQRTFAADLAAVRECLPHYWRKAWDRAAGPWYERGGRFASDYGRRFIGRTPFVTLRDSRGVYLTTIYLLPYVFSAKGPQTALWRAPTSQQAEA